jgi:putative endonuclease
MPQEFASQRKKAGGAGEEEACRFLAGLGYKIVKRNFQFGRIGVEVKARSQFEYGTPEESITPRKQAQLKKVASMYYYVNKLGDVDCRFDVIAIETIKGVKELRHHIRAFF